MNKKIFFSVYFLAALICASSVLAATWYVDKDATGSNAGTSWTNAWESFSDILTYNKRK